jgi:HK97 family phage major capsid protein
VSQAKRLVDEANRILDNAESVGRRLDGAERAEVEDLLDRAREHSDYEKRSRDIHTKLDGGYSGDPSVTWGHNDPGAKFVSSDGYRKIKSAASRGQTWSSGPVDVGLLAKGTLMENVGGAGPGGGLVPPQYAPGVVSTLFQPLGLADYFPQQTLTGSQLRYIVEGTATSTAAGVPEGGVKPEATLGYTEVVEPVKKLAQVVPVSDELLEDAVQIQQYVGGRLTMFVKVEEERQLLRGAGGNDLTGIFGRSISTTNAGPRTWTASSAPRPASGEARSLTPTWSSCTPRTG